MAKMAAMKKVLSPSSDTMITEMEAAKAWRKPRSLGPAGLTLAPALPLSVAVSVSVWITVFCVCVQK